jgi:hypothetical protein
VARLRQPQPVRLHLAAALEGGQCTACDLTRTRPADDDPQGIAQFAQAEAAKRRLVVELDSRGFALDGLVFDMLSSTAFGSFRDLVRGVWIPLSIALNQINLSMGKDDLYPFVIPEPVLDKLDFVATLAFAGHPDMQ